MSTILSTAIRNTQAYCDRDTSGLLKHSLHQQGFITSVIDFAQKNGGVGNAGFNAWNKAMKELITQNQEEFNKLRTEFNMTDDELIKQSFGLAKELSYQYQKAAQEKNFYTGRTDGLQNLVGQRLSRIPAEDTDNIVKSAFNILNPQHKK